MVIFMAGTVNRTKMRWLNGAAARFRANLCYGRISAIN